MSDQQLEDELSRLLDAARSIEPESERLERIADRLQQDPPPGGGGGNIRNFGIATSITGAFALVIAFWVVGVPENAEVTTNVPGITARASTPTKQEPTKQEPTSPSTLHREPEASSETDVLDRDSKSLSQDHIPRPRPRRARPSQGQTERADPGAASIPALQPHISQAVPPQQPTEFELLAEARASRDPIVALRICDQHAHIYRDGVLAPEREVIAIESLARLGRMENARARADRFLSLHPSSPHAPRIARALSRRGE